MSLAARLTHDGMNYAAIAPYWQWMDALKNSQLARDIRYERLTAKPNTPEAFYWEERCPSVSATRGRPRVKR